MATFPSLLSIIPDLNMLVKTSLFSINTIRWAWTDVATWSGNSNFTSENIPCCIEIKGTKTVKVVEMDNVDFVPEIIPLLVWLDLWVVVDPKFQNLLQVSLLFFFNNFLIRLEDYRLPQLLNKINVKSLGKSLLVPRVDFPNRLALTQVIDPMVLLTHISNGGKKNW